LVEYKNSICCGF